MVKKTATDTAVESVNNMYELMLILNPDLRESDVKMKLKEIEETITKAGGKITQEDFWGKKPLAYKIKRQVEGIYMIYNLDLPSSFLAELRAFLRIEKELLRSLIIKLPKGYTYTKYELVVPEEKPRKEKETFKKNISIKHNAPIYRSKKKEEKKEEKTEETASPEKSEAKEAERELELDKKLDQILGGEDLKL